MSVSQPAVFRFIKLNTVDTKTKSENGEKSCVTESSAALAWFGGERFSFLRQSQDKDYKRRLLTVSRPRLTSDLGLPAFVPEHGKHFCPSWKLVAMVDSSEFTRIVWDGNAERARELLLAGASPNATAPGWYWPPLHAAIENGQPECVRLLIEAGADVNRAMPSGLTPLAHAVDAESDAACQLGILPTSMSLEITEMLLAAGAVVTQEAVRWAERSYGSAQLKQRFAEAGWPGSDCREKQ